MMNLMYDKCYQTRSGQPWIITDAPLRGDSNRIFKYSDLVELEIFDSSLDYARLDDAIKCGYCYVLAC